MNIAQANIIVRKICALIWSAYKTKNAFVKLENVLKKHANLTLIVPKTIYVMASSVNHIHKTTSAI
jgi:hypothetical protein